MICRSEIDFPKLKTSYLAEMYHKRKMRKKDSLGVSDKTDRKVANTEGLDKVKVSSFKTKNWKGELKVYQACREVFKVEYDEGYHMGEFVNPPADVF